MGGVEFRGADADNFHLVLLIIARLKLWLILMACLCHLVSALTNIDDILKVALYPTFVIKLVTLANLMTFFEGGSLPISYLGSWTVLRQDLYHQASYSS